MFPHERSLLPIFLWRKGAQRPEQIGTGVYLAMGARSYVLTAAHVIDWLVDGDLCIPTKHGIRPVEGGVASNNLAPGEARTADRIDIGYMRLDKAHDLERHPDFVHLPRENVDPWGRVAPGDFCAIAGYPLTKGKHLKGALSSEAFSYVGIAAEHADYKRLGYDPKVHVLVEYRMKEAVYPEGDRVNPPHPRGLSGGGIFRLSPSFPLEPSGAPRVLVAHMHSFIKRQNLFVGTLLPVYLFNLATRYPDEVRLFTAA